MRSTALDKDSEDEAEFARVLDSDDEESGAARHTAGPAQTRAPRRGAAPRASSAGGAEEHKGGESDHAVVADAAVARTETRDAAHAGAIGQEDDEDDSAAFAAPAAAVEPAGARAGAAAGGEDSVARPSEGAGVAGATRSHAELAVVRGSGGAIICRVHARQRSGWSASGRTPQPRSCPHPLLPLPPVPACRQPLRARYCRVSQRYVATYDHFCSVAGTCIGERNRHVEAGARTGASSSPAANPALWVPAHSSPVAPRSFRFWLFVFTQAIVVWWAVGFVRALPPRPPPPAGRPSAGRTSPHLRTHHAVHLRLRVSPDVVGMVVGQRLCVLHGRGDVGACRRLAHGLHRAWCPLTQRAPSRRFCSSL